MRDTSEYYTMSREKEKERCLLFALTSVILRNPSDVLRKSLNVKVVIIEMSTLFSSVIRLVRTFVRVARFIADTRAYAVPVNSNQDIQSIHIG